MTRGWHTTQTPFCLLCDPTVFTEALNSHLLILFYPRKTPLSSFCSRRRNFPTPKVHRSSVTSTSWSPIQSSPRSRPTLTFSHPSRYGPDWPKYTITQCQWLVRSRSFSTEKFRGPPLVHLGPLGLDLYPGRGWVTLEPLQWAGVNFYPRTLVYQGGRTLVSGDLTTGTYGRGTYPQSDTYVTLDTLVNTVYDVNLRLRIQVLSVRIYKTGFCVLGKFGDGK